MSENLLSRIRHLPASMPSERGPLSADVYAIRGETAWWIFDVGACDEAADFINSLPCEVSAGDSIAGESSAGESRDGTARRLHQDAVPLKKNIVISHFHRDHFFNLSRIHFDNLYVGRETFRHCDETIRALVVRDASRGASCDRSPRSQSFSSSVTVVESPLQFDDGIRVQIMPIPSSHAKGSLMLTVSDAAPARGSGDAPTRGAVDATSRDVYTASDSIAFLGDSTYPTVGHGGPDFYNVQLLYQQIQFLRGCSAQRFVMSHRRLVPWEKESVLQLLESYYSQRQPNKNVIEVSR